MLRACTMKTISRCGCSMIAATATDHIGAKPVPLATSTRRPGWSFLKKARPYGPIRSEAHFPLRLLHDRGDRHRPHRREAGAAGDEHETSRMVLPEKGATIRPDQIGSPFPAAAAP